MAESLNEQQGREPAYLDEAEVITGPFFTDDRLEKTLQYEGIATIEPDLIAERHGIYIGALRLIAEDRRRQRALAAPDDAEQWNRLYDQNLTVKMIQNTVREQPEEVEKLTERLARINSAREPRHDVEDIFSLLYDHQKPYMRDVVAFLRHPVSKVVVPIEAGDNRRYSVKGAVVEAATGVGKSAIMGRTAMAADIGTPLVHGDRNHRALVVTPSRLINDQLAGVVGDDTFRRFAPPGIKVVSHSSENKYLPDPNADIVVTTIEQFVNGTRRGKFFGQEFDLMLVDEAHQLTEPQFQKVYLEEWRVMRPGGLSDPIPTIGFTARTAYDEKKDVEKLLPVVIRHESLKDYMKKDILSAGQFFTVIAEPEYEIQESGLADGDVIEGSDPNSLRNQALMQTVCDMALPLLQEGRRGIIFCESGTKSKQARDIAQYLNDMPRGDNQQTRAEALYVWSPKTLNRTKQKIQDFNDGRIDVLTTVGVGQQGLNADFNFVIICGNITSLQKLTQEIGRGMRRSKAFPTTVFVHVVAGYHDRPATTVTFGDIFDDDLAQGGVVKPEPVSGRTSRVRQDADAETVFDVERLPRKVQMLLRRVNAHVSQEIECQLNGVLPIPDDYVSFEKIYPDAGSRIDRAAAKRRLDAAGYAWRGRVESNNEGVKWLHRYYEPSAATFFTEKPVPAKATEEMKTAIGTAQHLGISETFLDTLREQMERQTTLRRVLRLNKRNAASLHYDADAISWLEEAVAKVEWQQDGDCTQRDIAEQLGIDVAVVARIRKASGIEPTYKRQSDGKGFAWLFDKELVRRIKESYTSIPQAGEEWSFVKIAEEAGIATKNVYKHLITEESAAICSLRTTTKSGQIKALDHLPPEMARAVVERIKETRLGMPAHLIPYVTIIDATHTTKKKIPAIVQDAELRQYGGNNYATRFVGWDGLRRIVEKYGWRDPEQAVDFDRLPKSAQDTDVDRQIYARAVQLKFMTALFMGNPDGIID